MRSTDLPLPPGPTAARLDERPMNRRVGWPTVAREPMPIAGMGIEAIQPPYYPVMSAPGAVASIRATVGSAPLRLEDHAPAEDPAPPRAPDPAEPPPEALEAVQAASEAYEILRRSGRELRFETGDNGVLRIEVYDGTGRLVRSIPPNEVLALASEGASWRA